MDVHKQRAEVNVIASAVEVPPRPGIAGRDEGGQGVSLMSGLHLCWFVFLSFFGNMLRIFLLVMCRLEMYNFQSWGAAEERKNERTHQNVALFCRMQRTDLVSWRCPQCHTILGAIAVRRKGKSGVTLRRVGLSFENESCQTCLGNSNLGSHLWALSNAALGSISNPYANECPLSAQEKPDVTTVHTKEM